MTSRFDGSRGALVGHENVLDTNMAPLQCLRDQGAEEWMKWYMSTLDIGGNGQQILTTKLSECIGGEVRQIFHVPVHARPVLPVHADLSASDNASVPVAFGPGFSPSLTAAVILCHIFLTTIKLKHGQWAQLSYGTAFLSFQAATWEQSK